MSFRETKAQARRDLHQTMGVPALYIAPTGEEIPCSVRVHTKFTQLGQMKGTNFNSAETEEDVPRLIFWAEEVQPRTGGTVTISEAHSGHGAREAYRIGVTLPRDGQTISARVADIPPERAASLPVRVD